MNEVQTAEISPWDNDPLQKLPMLQYNQREGNFVRRLSYQKSIDILNVKQKKRIKNRLLQLKNNKKQLQRNDRSSISYIPKKFKSKEFAPKAKKKQKMNLELKDAFFDNRSAIMPKKSNFKVSELSSCQFRQINKDKAMQKLIIQQLKMQQIFKNIQSIHWPTSRENINLPRIYLKM